MARGLPIFVVFLFLLFAETSYCQAPGQNNEQFAIEYARSLYAENIGNQSGIYNGPEYVGYAYPTKDGNPFFFSDEASMGDIYYDGLQYKNVPLWYDIAKNVVLVQHFNKLNRISLHSNKILSFSIFNHHFVNIDSAKANEYKLRPGFYDQIYKGESELIVRRSKESIIVTDQSGVWTTFSNEKRNIFLRKDNVYYPVSTQKSVLKILGKYDREIMQNLKANKIKFRRERERAIIMMVSYFDQLNRAI